MNVSRAYCFHYHRFLRFSSVTPLRSAMWGFFAASLCVLINSQFPSRAECTCQYIFARGRQANMCVSHLSPAARNRQENLGCFLHKRRLLLESQHQISVPRRLRGKRSKFPASYTKSRQSCMGVLFHPVQAQCNPAKICCGHWVSLLGRVGDDSMIMGQEMVLTTGSRNSW